MAATTVLTINGCIYEDMKPCFEDDVDITIVNDWALAPDADPEGIAYTFYIDGRIIGDLTSRGERPEK